jgi:ATP synthase protein I
MTHTTAPAAPGPFAVMLRGAFLPTLVVGPVAVLVAALAGGGRAALGACLGFLVTVAFFALGLLVMQRLVRDGDPLRFMASAMAVFLGQLLFLLLVIVGLQQAGWLDGAAFGLSALAVALVWQVCQVVAFVRSRHAVYDVGGDAPSDVPADAQHEATSHAPPGGYNPGPPR